MLIDLLFLNIVGIFLHIVFFKTGLCELGIVVVDTGAICDYHYVVGRFVVRGRVIGGFLACIVVDLVAIDTLCSSV